MPTTVSGRRSRERDFAKENPCITVDGCQKKCAAVGVKKYGGVIPRSSIVISDIVETFKFPKPTSKSKILSQDEKVVRKTMKIIDEKIKTIKEGKN